MWVFSRRWWTATFFQPIGQVGGHAALQDGEAAVDTFGRDTGFTATSGGEHRSFRLDTDDRIGPHINVMTGKGASVREWAIRFPGGSISTWLRRNV